MLFNLIILSFLKIARALFTSPKEKVIKESYQKIIEKLKIEGDLSLSGDKISGGEKQKVAIARALIHDPDFIIADEPTGNLDHENTLQIADILIKANQIGNTIVLVTHDAMLLDYLSKRVNIKTVTLGLD